MERRQKARESGEVVESRDNAGNQQLLQELVGLEHLRELHAMCARSKAVIDIAEVQALQLGDAWYSQLFSALASECIVLGSQLRVSDCSFV